MEYIQILLNCHLHAHLNRFVHSIIIELTNVMSFCKNERFHVRFHVKCVFDANFLVKR